MAALEKTTPIDLAANERAAKSNLEDRKYHFDVQRPYDLKIAEFNLTRARNFFEYSEEELRQLEKMYKADDVTEETEAIVLKRARDQLESRESFPGIQSDVARPCDQFRHSSHRRASQGIQPAQGVGGREGQDRLARGAAAQQIEVEKQRVQNARSAERLKKLLADREQLTVNSPLEGVVYYGKCTRGKISDAQSLADSLRPTAWSR